MGIRRITRTEFDAFSPQRNPNLSMYATERAWFAAEKASVIGCVLLDKTDRDWNVVILGPDDAGDFRWITGQTSFKRREEAESSIIEAMSRIEETGTVSETLFKEDATAISESETSVLFCDINDQLKGYFSRHPERLYDLQPRKFEELIASVLEDLGFDVELTQATRDGGRDIIAWIRNAVCSYLTFVECKRYAPDRKVGVGVVREVAGVHHLRRASKSLIVTTSFFTKNAIEEARRIEHELELKDYVSIKEWLARYP